ncbi:type II toxin-antitoxin system RelE family toxin [Clostridium felsineum]|uniref:Uncharacterized protein n=1 Tax=Clostridium felsineum TaxID=36839 RepID=A0A1S8LJE5_9CLOT|nr:hypothetical protein [Clostridium felsineum]URZ05796.1 hypothetical protein CLROS_011270 [Clostridium felsineum]URZ10835.1 hypothetical protein CROST_015500 [Clostridium felsineum]
MADKIKMELLLMESMISKFRAIGDRSNNIINRLRQIENGVKNSYIADSSIKIQGNIDDVLKSGREVTEEIYKLSIQLNGAKTALINADKNSSNGMKVSYGILYRGDNGEGLSKTTNKSAKILDRKENLFEESKDKAEDFLEIVSSKTKEIVDNAPSELEEAFKETEDFVSKAIDRLNKSLADFKYIAGSVVTHPLLFMYGLSNSVVDNFTGNKTLQEAIKHNYEYRFETDKDYKSLTALKAGETTGDVGSMAAGGALMGGGGAVDGAGYVFAVPTLGTVTVPAEAVGTTAIAAGGLILGRSSLKFGGDAGSVFKYADMGENANKSGNVTNKSFWKAYNKLPKDIQKQADEAFKIFKQNPNHPGLNFEQLSGGKYFSVRINGKYRAYGRKLMNGQIEWVEINGHDYNKAIRNLQNMK